MFSKRSFGLFKLFAFLGGIAFICFDVMGLNAGIEEGLPKSGYVVFVFIGILGIALLLSAIIMHLYLGNKNKGKKDESIYVSYAVSYRGNTQMLENASQLSKMLGEMHSGEEISIHLTPEYYGLTDWKFIKRKDHYISFVWIHKRNKTIQYFIMPEKYTSIAMNPFIEVFEEHKAINTSKLISMKRYQGVLDVYNLK